MGVRRAAGGAGASGRDDLPVDDPGPEPIRRNPPYEVMRAVLDCALDGLSWKPGRALLAPGSTVPWDECCDGMLWVVLTGLSPMRSGAACLGWNAGLQVGILRCCAVLDDFGNPPPPETVEADAEAVLRDSVELANALTCCPAVKSLTGWSPLGPEGGCAGGAWTVSAHVPDCWDCP